MSRGQIIFVIILLFTFPTIVFVEYLGGYYDKKERVVTVVDYSTYRSVSRGNVYTHYTIHGKLEDGTLLDFSHRLYKPVINNTFTINYSDSDIDNRRNSILEFILKGIKVSLTFLSSLVMLVFLLAFIFGSLWEKLREI